MVDLYCIKCKTKTATNEAVVSNIELKRILKKDGEEKMYVRQVCSGICAECGKKKRQFYGTKPSTELPKIVEHAEDETVTEDIED